MSAPPASPPAFTPARPEDQSFVPARPQDQGFVPARPEDAATEQPKHWYDTAVKEVGDVASGFKTALNQTGETGMKIVGATGIPQRINPEGWEQSRQQTHDIAHAPLDTGGKMAGAAIENIIEFFAGDEALKGLTIAAKVKELSSVERALKNSPIMTRMLGNAVRAQTVGTTQAAAHGASGGQAVATGSIAAVGGAGLEGLMVGGSKFLNLIRPTTEKILDEEIPVLASQAKGASPSAESIADIRSTPKYATAQQELAQRGIVNRAQRTAASELHKLNAARAARWVEGEGMMNLAEEPAAATIPPGRQLTNGQPRLPAATATGAPQLEAGAAPSGMARTGEIGAFEGDFPPQPNGAAAAPTAPTAETPTTPARPNGQRVKFVEEQPPNFPSIPVEDEIKNVRSFGDAGDLIRKHASPVFDRVDKATGGEYMRLRDLRDAAYAAEDYNGVRSAEKAIDDLFPSLRGKVDRADYSSARSAWKTSKVLDAVHNAVDRSLNIGDESLAADSGVFRGINGGTLMRGINRLVRDYGRTAIEDVIGKDGLTGLTKISALTQTPQRAALYGQKVGDVAHAALGAERAGLIPSTIDWSRRALLHQFATNPRAAQAMEFALKHDIPATTTFKILTTLMGNQMRIEDENVVPADESRGVKPVNLPVLKEDKP